MKSFGVLFRVVFISCPVWSFPTQRQHTSGGSSSTWTDPSIWDNVFSSSVCSQLHTLALEHNERYRDGTIFRLQDPHTPLEWALHSFLEKCYGTDSHSYDDDDYYVEYWTRAEYMNLEAHCDVDEKRLDAFSTSVSLCCDDDNMEMMESPAIIRCPTWAHVLYLQMDANERVGPTCVFPHQVGGWTTEARNSVRKKQTNWFVVQRKKWQSSKYCWIDFPTRPTGN